MGELTHALKTEQARFGTWAKEVARDREQVVQDKAQMTECLDKALTLNEALADRVTDLEQKHADQSPVTSAGAPERRIRAEEGVARQTDRSTYGG
jgi:predicted nucleic acid-binding Zn ribbon protein